MTNTVRRIGPTKESRPMKDTFRQEGSWNP
jgi:hypothetical protein